MREPASICVSGRVIWLPDLAFDMLTDDWQWRTDLMWNSSNEYDREAEPHPAAYLVPIHEPSRFRLPPRSI